MEFNKSLVLMVSLSCLLLSGINAVPTTRTQLLEEGAPAAAPASQYSADLVALCQDAENADLCMRTIAPAINGALDPVVALRAEIRVTLNLTNKIAEIIKKLRDDPSISKDESSSLEICDDQYSSIVDTISETLDSIQQNDVYSAWTKFSSVISFQQTCEDTFKEGTTPIPFAEDSQTLFQLGGNCLAILQRLSGESPLF